MSANPFDPNGAGWIDAAFGVAHPAFTGDGAQGHDIGVIGLLLDGATRLLERMKTVKWRYVR